MGTQLVPVRLGSCSGINTHLDKHCELTKLEVTSVCELTTLQYTAARSQYGYTEKFGGCWQNLYYSDYTVTVYVRISLWDT